MDGTNGFRFKPKSSLKLNPGDEVEVVGFPDMNGTSPLLREALTRRIGHADLPEPRPLVEDTLPSTVIDADLAM